MTAPRDLADDPGLVMDSPIEIVTLGRHRRDLRRFIRAGLEIYRGDPLWVAPLEMDLLDFLGAKNPLFEHIEIAFWLARQNGSDVGRIAAILDSTHNRVHQDAAAFFGYFECPNQPEVSRALFDRVFEWARARGMNRVLGPMNPTTNNECGLLVDGFDCAPVLMMSYNPRFYPDLIQAAGFAKAKDLLAFVFDVGDGPLERLERAARIFARKSTDIVIRPVRKKSLGADLQRIKEVYNAAWEKNWGFVPMTDSEIEFMAERLKPLLMEGLAWLAETPREAVAFLLALPDFNEALQPLAGRLVSPGLFQALPYLLGRKRPQFVRVVTLGIKEAFRKRGVEALMLLESLRFSLRVGFKQCEASWILEDNVAVQRLIELFGGRRYKTYRIYERPLDG